MEEWSARCQWLTPAILATLEGEIRRIKVRGQPTQIFLETAISKITRPTWTGGVAQMVESTYFANMKP
jgi:hypothetical protein